MFLGRGAGAAILEDHHLVIAVMRVARAGMHHPVGGDAAHDEPLDIMGAQDGLQ